MFTEDLKQIKAIANAVGFKRSGDSNGYLKFVEEEAAKEQATIDAIVSETNKTMRAVETKRRAVAVQAERRRLQKEPTGDIFTVVPRVTIDDVKDMTEDQVTQQIKTAVAQFRSKIDISKADFTFLTNVMSVNEVDPRFADNWERVLDWAIKRLELIEQGGPIPEKAAPSQPEPQERCPFPVSSLPNSAYAQWQQQHLQEQAYNEVMPLVIETLEPIIKSVGSKDFEAASMRHLIDTLRKKNLVINRSNIRAEWLRIWAKECTPEGLAAAFTEEELRDYNNDLEDRHLSSEGLKRKYLYGQR